VILEGATIKAVQGELWLLLACFAVTFAAALRIFRWR